MLYKNVIEEIKRFRNVSESSGTSYFADDVDRCIKYLLEHQIGVAITSPGNDLLEFNDSLLDMFGYLRKDIAKMNWEELTHPEDLEIDLVHIDRIVAGEINDYSMEKRFIHSNGSVLYTLISVNPVRGDDGKVKYFVSFVIDITERKQEEKAFNESETKYKTLFEQSADATLVLEGDKFVDRNSATVKMLGYQNKQELLKTHPSELSPQLQADGRDSFEKANKIMSIAFDQGSHRFEWDHKRQNGEVFPVEVLLTAIPFGERKILHVVWRDIAERKKAEYDLANRTNQLIQNQKVLWELAQEDLSNKKYAFNRIIKTDAERLNVERVSIWLFNETRTELVCKALYQNGKFNNEELTLSADHYPRYFHALAEKGYIMADDACNDPDTREFTEGYLDQFGITSMMDVPIQLHGEMIGVVCHEHIGTMRKWSVEDEDFARSIADMCALALATSKSKQAERKLSHQACHDPLTGLNNRYEFERRVARLLATVKEDKSEHAICFMDLDQFKIINDTCGHTAGDELLRQLSSVLINAVRHRDTLARLGGDEFGVLIEHCSIDDAYRVAKSLKKAIQNFQFSWEGKLFKIGVSIGLTAITDDKISLTELLKQADASCYMAKDKGRNRIHIYHAEDLEMSQRHGEMEWVSRINQALEEDLFCLYAQAIVPLDGSKNDHHELLIRMIGEQGEIIPPGTFLPAAERYNLMSKIDRWVIKKAFSLLENDPALAKKILSVQSTFLVSRLAI